MNLHPESSGDGPPLLLIPGWGMHCGIWGRMAEQLALRFRVHCVDFPGYSNDHVVCPYDLDGLVHWFSDRWDSEYPGEPLALCGWSLGGLVALRWAHLVPHQVNKLVLIATTPSFVQRRGWEYAMPVATLDEFSVSFLENPEQTLKRFIAMQALGSENERRVLKDLRDHLCDSRQPNIAALREGLSILRDTDLRMLLPQITHSSLVIAGESDVLAVPAASVFLAQQLPNAQLFNIDGASHVPFLSHPDSVIQRMEVFLNG